VLIERWTQHDYTEHLSVVRHPGDELHDYLQQSFTRLKREQAHELEATQGSTGQRGHQLASPASNAGTHGRLVISLDGASMPFQAGHVAD
jgi:hypothetical protein